MTLKSKVKVTVTFSNIKAYNSAVPMGRTLKLSRCWSSPVDDPEGKGQGHQDLYYWKLDNLDMLGTKKGCWSSPVDDTKGKGHGQGHLDL